MCVCVCVCVCENLSRFVRMKEIILHIKYLFFNILCQCT